MGQRRAGHDTAAFAVSSIRTWWNTIGTATYPGAARLLITADCGGSNGNRVRLWKTELAALAAGTGLSIQMCHHPPGTRLPHLMIMTCQPKTLIQAEP